LILIPSCGASRMAKPWPASLAIAEGLANVNAGRRLSTIIVGAVALVTSGVGLANVLDVSVLVDAEREWIASGAYVFVVEPNPGNGDSAIDIATCDRLAQVEGIDASFAVRVTDAAAEPASAPGTRATLARTSPGIYAFLSVPPPTGSGMLVSESVAGQTGLADGETTTFSIQSIQAATSEDVLATVRRIDNRMLAESLEGSYLFPSEMTGDSAQCYVRTDAAHASDVRDYIAIALTPEQSSPAIVRPRLNESTNGLDFASAFTNRALTWGWAAGAAVLILLWALTQWTRRTRDAIYATFGAHARARLIIQMTEWFTLSTIGLAWGWAIATAFAIGLGSDIEVTLVHASAQAFATWAAASIGAVMIGLTPVGTLIDTLKDRT